MEKVVKLQLNSKTYKSLAIKHIEENDYIGALGFFLSALNIEPNDISLISQIADLYSDMDQIDLSNKFWFTYLDKAQKDEKSLAYEELAINYFYLDNLYATNFYLNQKIKQDGFLSREKFEQEIPEFFNQKIEKKSLYHIAYPFNRADFSARAKLAKEAFSSGNYEVASMIYESIPSQCRSEEVDGEYAVTNLISNNDKKVIEIAKDSLLKHGENVTAYCNLSSAYRNKRDTEKAHYYYQKALESRKGTREENYEIATCAIEEKDDIVANSCIAEIVKERPYDATMLFFYGISFLNLGNFEKGKEQIDKAYKIDTENSIYLFYLKYAENLIKEGRDSKGFLPLDYKKDLPLSVTKNYQTQISKMIESGIVSKKDKQKINEILNWGVKYGKDIIAKKCVFLFSILDDKKAQDILTNYLLDTEISDEVKGSIIYTLILEGRKERFGVVDRAIYTSVKPRKLPFEGKPQEVVYLPAYALCMTKAVLFGEDDLDKIGFAINKVYKEKNTEIESNCITVEELACITLKKSGLKRFSKLNNILKAFGIKKERIDIISKIIGSEKNENN